MFPDLDAAYQRQLETQMHVRKTVALVATSRKRLQLEIERLEQEAGERNGQGCMSGAGEVVRDTAEARFAELRRRYAAIQAREELIAATSMRLQAEINNFRAAMKAIEAASTAAEEAAKAVLAEAAGAAGGGS